MAGRPTEDWRGRKVLDRDGATLGRLEAVYLDRETDRPKWGLVKGGRLRPSRLVPLGQASVSGKKLQVPVARGRAKRAPELEPGEALSSRQEWELSDHYGLEQPERYRSTTNGASARGRESTDENRREERAVARERSGGDPGRQAGGLKFGAALFGWLVAVVLGVILSAIAGAIAGAIGAATGPPSLSAAGTAAIVGAVIVLLALALAYFAGGYVAGRMARFDGVKHGVAVWVIGLIVTLLVGLLGTVLGSAYDVVARLGLARLPIDAGSFGLGALVSLLAILLLTLVAAVLGGKTGTRFHRRIDRAGTV